MLNLICYGQTEQKRPNSLFVLIDDQSAFDLKLYDENSILETPNIDKLAKGGMVFESANHMGSMKGADSRGLENNYCIIPMPYSIEVRGGKPFQMNAETAIVYQDKEQKACAEYLQERIAGSTGMKLAIKKSGSSNAIVLQVEPETVEFAEKDTYTFESSKDRITITGKSASGLFYGIQTLFQLLPAGIYSDSPLRDMTLSVDPLLIKDKSSVSRIRGLHVDIARHFRTKEELMKIIESMAMHKLNTLHLHLSDVRCLQCTQPPCYENEGSCLREVPQVVPYVVQVTILC